MGFSELIITSHPSAEANAPTGRASWSKPMKITLIPTLLLELSGRLFHLPQVPTDLLYDSLGDCEPLSGR
jgi:hypothetical protein